MPISTPAEASGFTDPKAFFLCGVRSVECGIGLGTGTALRTKPRHSALHIRHSAFGGMMPRPLLLRGGQILDPSSGRDEPGDLLLVDGTVAAVGGDFGVPDGAETVEVAGQ